MTDAAPDGPDGPAPVDAFAPTRDLVLMRHALELARQAGAAGDVPVGAVVARADGTVLGAAGNERQRTGDPTAHAEVLALRRAAETLGGWNLAGTVVAVTVEPCAMCAGALANARVGEVVFGCFEPRTGAVGSLWDVLRDPRLPVRIAVRSGVLAGEAAGLLRDFFAQRR